MPTTMIFQIRDGNKPTCFLSLLFFLAVDDTWPTAFSTVKCFETVSQSTPSFIKLYGHSNEKWYQYGWRGRLSYLTKCGAFNQDLVIYCSIKFTSKSEA